MNRNHYTEDQHRAARILDAVRAGFAVGVYEVRWALYVLGEPVAD